MIESGRGQTRSAWIALCILVVIATLFMAVVGAAVKMSDRRERRKQANSAAFVRNHSCYLSYIGKSGYDYDAQSNTIIATRGFKAYKCPDYGVTVTIWDDEVQP